MPAKSRLKPISGQALAIEQAIADIAIEQAIVDTPPKAKWKPGGKRCLTVEHGPATKLVRQEGHEGLKAEIWMERPLNGKAVCKFEIASIPSTPLPDNKPVRERLAASLRKHLVESGLPSGVEESSGSTAVKCRLDVPGIRAEEDDTEENARRYANEVEKIVAFFRFLDSQLAVWAGEYND